MDSFFEGAGEQLRRMQAVSDAALAHLELDALLDELLLRIRDALDTERSPRETAELYYALSDHLNIDSMLTAISGLERGNRWHALARLALRDDLYSSLRAITLDVLRQSDPGTSADDKIVNWEQVNARRLSRSRESLDEIRNVGTPDLATLSVATRQVRSMVR